jgi:thiol-disulfide isomerase/thioredoxin
MTTVMTPERFLQGATPQEHVGQMKINKDRFEQILANVELSPEAKDYFSSLAAPLRVAVITEDWCGDHLSTTPVLYKLAEDTGKLEVRVFMRDQNWDLADAFLPAHRRDTVPVFVFFTPEEMRWISVFIETSTKIVPAIDGMDEDIRRAHPDVADINSDVNEMSQETRNLLRQERVAYRINRAGEWGKVISGDMREVIEAGLSRKPDEGPSEGGTKWPPD